MHTPCTNTPQADKRRNRTKLIEFFTDTALECQKLHNFNSYMAISGEEDAPSVHDDGLGMLMYMAISGEEDANVQVHGHKR